MNLNEYYENLVRKVYDLEFESVCRRVPKRGEDGENIMLKNQIDGMLKDKKFKDFVKGKDLTALYDWVLDEENRLKQFKPDIEDNVFYKEISLGALLNSILEEKIKYKLDYNYEVIPGNDRKEQKFYTPVIKNELTQLEIFANTNYPIDSLANHTIYKIAETIYLRLESKIYDICYDVCLKYY